MLGPFLNTLSAVMLFCKLIYSFWMISSSCRYEKISDWSRFYYRPSDCHHVWSVLWLAELFVCLKFLNLRNLLGNFLLKIDQVFEKLVTRANRLSQSFCNICLGRLLTRLWHKGLIFCLLNSSIFSNFNNL